MSKKRLVSRCSTAIHLDTAKIKGYKLAFNKKSTRDSSGKANIIKTDNLFNIVWGVIYEIEETQKANLDIAEGNGNGYEKQIIKATNSNGHEYECVVYIAKDPRYLDNDLTPMDWYLEHCLIGARENRMPEEYISFIKSQSSIIDTNIERAQREISIYK